MKKLTLSIMACVMFAMVAQALNQTVETTITLAAVGTTNTVPNVNVGPEWTNLNSIHVAFPPNSTSTVAFYCVSDSATEWQIGDSITYANATALTVSQSYYPLKATNFINANLSTNIVLTAYPVKGTIKYILTKTGAASQSFKPVLLLTK